MPNKCERCGKSTPESGLSRMLDSNQKAGWVCELCIEMVAHLNERID